jgi:hypothetical protein
MSSDRPTAQPPIAEASRRRRTRVPGDDEVEALRAALRDLDLGSEWDRRFDGRFLGQVGWMQAYAQKNRLLHQTFRMTVIVAGVTVPALVSLNLTGDAATWVRWLTFSLSLVAAIAAAVDEFFAFGDKWRHFRGIAETLKSEGWSFVQGVGPYNGLDREAASRLLAAQVENISKREWETYLATIVAERTASAPGGAGASRRSGPTR